MQVQIVSDVVCPWCRIGKTNLKKAADQFTAETGEPVEVSFLPFLLDPIQPEEEGESFRERFLKRKGLTEEQMQGMFHQVTAAGANYGVRFDFEKVAVAVNTVPAHELMELVPEHVRWDLMDTMMKGYFEDGANIGDIDVLLGMAKSHIDEASLNEIEPALRNRSMQETVMATIQQMQQNGVSGVPFTIIDNRYAINGGQPPDVFLSALRQAYQDRAAAPSE